MANRRGSAAATAPHYGALVARLRTERRLRQQDVAALLGISTSTLSTQERTAKCHLRRATVQRMVEQLGRLKPLDPADHAALLEGAHLPPTAVQPTEPALPMAAGGLSAPGVWASVCDHTYRELRQHADPQVLLAGLLELATRLHVAVPPPPPPAADQSAGAEAEADAAGTNGTTTRKRNTPHRTAAKRGVA
jgi:hypothetical protein